MYLDRQTYPSSFAPQARWQRSITRITYLSKLIGVHSLAAFLQRESHRVNPSSFAPQARWQRSITRITYLSKLIGVHSLPASRRYSTSWV